MTKEEIRAIALRQSAADLGCEPADFTCGHSVIVHSTVHPDARCYLELPFFCNLVSYGDNVVASVAPEAENAVRAYLEHGAPDRPEAYFETPNLHRLSDALRPFDRKLCFMAEYFLPDPARLRPLDCRFALRELGPPDFAPLYTDTWSNALCAKRRQLDVLGVGAYDGETLVGLAGCSADCGAMWQIGIDVLPAYRRQGIAAALVSRLACMALARGKVPFYCAAWSNIRSVRTAIHCGFVPAWVELTAKSGEFVQKMLEPPGTGAAV